MPKSLIGSPVPNPDGTSTVYIFDSDTGQTSTQVVGTPVDPVAAAEQRGQAAAAQTRAQYSDPWYQQNFLDPLNAATAAQTADRATQLKQQAQTLAMQGRTAEAAIANQQAQVELRKQELRNQQQSTANQNQQFYAGQQLSANLALGQMRGPGNAAQFIDTGERLNGMGIRTGSLGDIAAGRMPQGAFTPGGSGQPVSMADRMSGLLGAPSQSAIAQRDANDRALATQIYSAPQALARGSLESLGPYRRAYLGSYGEAQGFDDPTFQDQYQRAGVMQGRTVS